MHQYITDVSPEEEEAQVKASETRRRHPLRNTLIAVLILLFCAFGGLTAVLYGFSGPITVGIGETVSHGIITENPVLSLFVTPEKDPAEIETGCIRDELLKLKFFGFLPKSRELHVRDLLPPEFSVCNLTVMQDTDITAFDCVTSYADQTDLTFAFSPEPDTGIIGVQEISVSACDEGGNTVSHTVTLTVVDAALAIRAEFGTDAEQLLADIRESHPQFEQIDLSRLDFSVCGTYRINARSSDTYYLLNVDLSDTTPPKARIRSFDILAGSTLTPEDFMTKVEDLSPVTLSFVNEPDFDNYAPQTVSVAAEDAFGNRTILDAELHVWNIPGEFSFECGESDKAFSDSLFADFGTSSRPSIPASFKPSELKPGDYSLKLQGTHNNITISVAVRDTKAPVLALQDAAAYLNHVPELDAFLVPVEHAKETTVSFATEPDVSAVGTPTLIIGAEDAFGNRSEATAKLTVIADTTPPVISGVKTIQVKRGETASYRKNVSAWDAADGAVSVSVDTSSVDLNKNGTYTIIYTAKDSSGNVATVEAKVVVSSIDQAAVDAQADAVLAAITNQKMTQKQKITAIYDWCVKNIRYSTSTSNLMGQYVAAAYSGFTTKAGNCYTYYAVSSALLTRAGVENIMIQRDDPDKPHYWNLLKYNNNWYHMDTCPHYKGHFARILFATDADLAAYCKNHVAG
ncbi:MAG: DUF5011 domain-containing protein, partial [Clostridia bacterium]|nr:DUF5011 domain-containing protein [Clostridia bacterium]